MIHLAISIVCFVVVVYAGLMVIMLVGMAFEKLTSGFSPAREPEKEVERGPELKPGNSFVIVNGKRVKK